MRHSLPLLRFFPEGFRSTAQRWWWGLFALSILLSGLVFGWIFWARIPADQFAHVDYIQGVLLGKEPFLPNFLFFLVIILLALGSTQKVTLALVMTACLALSVGAKYWLSLRFTQHELQRHQLQGRSLPSLLFVSLFLLLWCFNLPGPSNFMLGQFSPNLWHNSTMIFLMPFAVGLFGISWQYILQPRKGLLWLMALLIVLNILIKPSFYFCFLPAFGLMMLWQHGLKPAFWQSLWPLLVGLLLLGIEYWFFYVLEHPESTHIEQAGIALDPLAVWTHYSRNPVLSFLASTAFPLSVGILFPSVWREEKAYVYSWLLFLFGLVLFIFLIEEGERAFHGNFGWQLFAANYMLFLTSLGILIKQYYLDRWQNRAWILLAIFILHLFSGLIYFQKLSQYQYTAF
ncbi:MAG: hypothetical protein AAFR61_02000 [Bacteroidota bacterium]